MLFDAKYIHNFFQFRIRNRENPLNFRTAIFQEVILRGTILRGAIPRGAILLDPFDITYVLQFVLSMRVVFACAGFFICSETHLRAIL